MLGVPHHRLRKEHAKSSKRAALSQQTVYIQPPLTLQDGSSGVIEVSGQEVGIAGWDDGELGAASMHCALPMSKLVEVLADMSLVCSELQTHSNFPLIFLRCAG